MQLKLLKNYTRPCIALSDAGLVKECVHIRPSLEASGMSQNYSIIIHFFRVYVVISIQKNKDESDGCVRV